MNKLTFKNNLLNYYKWRLRHLWWSFRVTIPAGKWLQTKRPPRAVPSPNMKTITQNCKNCSTKFEAQLKETRRGYGIFCSRTCSSKYNSRQFLGESNVECAYCQILFHKSESSKAQSKSKLYFCRREHKDLAQRLNGIKTIHPIHYNPKNPHDYRQIAFSSLPHKCNNCNYSKNINLLEVHHIDTNHKNNQLENLIILCPTCHEEQHYLTKTGKWSQRNLQT